MTRLSTKTALKRGKKLTQKPPNEQSRKERSENSALLYSTFVQVWDSREHKSEVSGIWLSNELKSIYCHHILPKSKYKEYAYDVDNIILLTWEEHSSVESDMYRYPEVNKRREQLKEKYGI